MTKPLLQSPPSKDLAGEVDELLMGMGLKKKTTAAGKLKFYASDAPERFKTLGKKFGVPVDKVVIRCFD